MQHTLGHIDCPACAQHEVFRQIEISREMLYPDASREWIASREFPGDNQRAKYLRKHSLRDLRDYDKALCRFFGMLKLNQIRLGHFCQYQFERSSGLLGPRPEELFPVYLKRVTRSLRKKPEEVQADPYMLSLVRAQIEALPQREVGPNKVNQELGLLKRIMQRAGVWTAEMEENYEPLQHEESDIPRGLSPEEQEIFLGTAQGVQSLIHQYAIVGIDCTLSTFEERGIKLGDINLVARILLVRSKSAKNKYRIRTIPLSDQAVWAFERLLERANELGSFQPQHYLFPLRIARDRYDPNQPMTVSGIKKTWDEVRRAAGVPWFTPYGLRHTGCTRLAEAGTAIHVILSMAGHMSRRTQEHYIQISEQAKRTAVNRASLAASPDLAKGKWVQSAGTTRAGASTASGRGSSAGYLKDKGSLQK